MDKNYDSPELSTVDTIADAGIAACDCQSDFIEKFEVGEDKDDETAGF